MPDYKKEAIKWIDFVDATMVQLMSLDESFNTMLDLSIQNAGVSNSGLGLSGFYSDQIVFSFATHESSMLEAVPDVVRQTLQQHNLYADTILCVRNQRISVFPAYQADILAKIHDAAWDLNAAGPGFGLKPVPHVFDAGLEATKWIDFIDSTLVQLMVIDQGFNQALDQNQKLSGLFNRSLTFSCIADFAEGLAGWQCTEAMTVFEDQLMAHGLGVHGIDVCDISNAAQWILWPVYKQAEVDQIFAEITKRGRGGRNFGLSAIPHDVPAVAPPTTYEKAQCLHAIADVMTIAEVTAELAMFDTHSYVRREQIEYHNRGISKTRLDELCALSLQDLIK